MTPLYAQNQIIITPSVHYIDRLRSIFFVLKTDERKAFASTSISVPSNIYPYHTTERSLRSLSWVSSGIFVTGSTERSSLPTLIEGTQRLCFTAKIVDRTLLPFFQTNSMESKIVTNRCFLPFLECPWRGIYSEMVTFTQPTDSPAQGFLSWPSPGGFSDSGC